MDQLAQRLQRGAGDAGLDDVLDRLDVVHGLALKGGVLGDGVGIKLRRDVAQQRRLVVGQRAHSGHRIGLAQVDEPLDLDVQAHAVERGLGQVVDQRRHRAAVAAVERPQRDGGLHRRQGHRRSQRVGGGTVRRGHGVIVSRETVRDRESRRRSSPSSWLRG